ncbi:DUF2252 family protein [Pseudoteredinibacter isoporae]|uniref:Uncharacterized protein (DUF2252 family) n=1 Tax=Pseudoteredinibacter isoporae TaxID=570281 RepID=A0A7X0MW92_9GAMM|nr:DUF2252 family protein [Pseudoteredinibacter isoporae]MBB6520684.1 uncharacterized protein (DUF2252 family) [Pseudoteredinibacter isoporae]NHO86251.1 DUF2252 family protein [Pseudoteredinibacter isoporae]NIB25298.1 DUF2252 family protein [Pseudoteredinibacter isoporae]
MSARHTEVQECLKRVDQKLGIPKHHKMSLSPFIFFRGSAPLFYQDLASGLLQVPQALQQMPLTTIMGDCHSSNFGFLSEEGSHSSDIIFSPNDFDDACIGHASWDLLRFSCSLFLCAAHCQAISEGRFDTKDGQGKVFVDQQGAEEAALAFVQAYSKTCSGQEKELYQSGLDQFPEQHFLFKSFNKAKRRAAGGEDFYRKSAIAKSVDLDAQPLRFATRADRFELLSEDQLKAIHFDLAPFVDDCILDIVKRLNAGTGSVNMDRYYLLVGPEGAGKNELELCHLVEVKHQREAAPIHYFPDLSPNNRLNPAHLTVMCQRRMQRSPDMVLDETEWRDGHWLIRSRHHARLGFDPEDIALGKKAARGGFTQYAEACGTALALAHCRGDRRSQRFEQSVQQQLIGQEHNIVSAAKTYAKQVEQDCRILEQLLQSEG